MAVGHGLDQHCGHGGRADLVPLQPVDHVRAVSRRARLWGAGVSLGEGLGQRCDLGAWGLVTEVWEGGFVGALGVAQRQVVKVQPVGRAGG